MDNEPKQTTDAADNGMEKLEKFQSGILDTADLLGKVATLAKELERIAENNWDDELERHWVKLVGTYPHLARWELFLLEKAPEFASDFLPRYWAEKGEFLEGVANFNESLAKINGILAEQP